MTTTEERLSRLEGAYEHVATKADIADLRAELKSDMASLRGDMAGLKTDLIRWMVGLMLGGAIATAAIISAVVSVMAGLD